MAGIKLYEWQTKALHHMHNGCVLCGGVGSGKSRTAIAYYYLVNGGEINEKKYIPMSDTPPRDLYIITTARKRDTCEWQGDLAPFLLSPDPKACYYPCRVVIDSWNNIKKYIDVSGAFFIFDEQRLVGRGAWVNSFLKIAKRNKWILLSATPGDTWSDYIAVFIANGFYRNRTEFAQRHIVYSRFTDYPKIERYIDTRSLTRYRDKILVDMDFHRKTKAIHEYVMCDYDKDKYDYVKKNYRDPWTNQPIKTPSEKFQIYRRLVNSDFSRRENLVKIFKEHPKLIIFYNYSYERDILYNIFTSMAPPLEIAEWSGYCHQPVPESDRWVYFVQYNAGCEAWNCITTDTIVFYSQNYSWRIMEQACGRIDRLNTPYLTLYYYHFTSNSEADRAIQRALKEKKIFNESRYVKKEEARTKSKAEKQEKVTVIRNAKGGKQL